MKPVDPVDEWHKAQKPKVYTYVSGPKQWVTVKVKAPLTKMLECPNQMTIFDILEEE